ncbi:hypothetical protein ACKFKG_24265 [Phormidesmis sp. 146-35]
MTNYTHAIVKATDKATGNIKFENDFGQNAIALAKFTKDQGAIGVATVLGTFVGMAMAGFPLAAIVALVGLNDLMYAHKLNKDAEAKTGKTEREIQREEWQQWDIAQSYQPTVQTQLGAVEVKSSPVTECQPSDLPDLGTAPIVTIPQYELEGSSVATQTACPVSSSESIEIAESLAVNLQSSLIVGPPGAGKGVIVAIASRAVKRLHPDVTIWAIDPKADASEAHYWEAVDHYLPLHIDPFTSAESMVEVMATINCFIQKFQKSKGAKLLIFDEALAVKEKTGKWFKELMAGFNTLCSMGRSKREYGWLLAQSPDTEAFEIGGGVRNIYRRILLLSQDNLELLDNHSTYFSGKPSPDHLSKTGRVYFDSIVNGWGSVPVYQVPLSPVVTTLAASADQAPTSQRGFSANGEFHREKLEALLKVETPERNFNTDAIVELLKKSAEFIKDKSKQDSEGWVDLNDFIKSGSTKQDQTNRKRAFTTLRMKYSQQYEYQEVELSDGGVSRKMRSKRRSNLI